MATVEEFREQIIRLKPGNFMALQGSASGILGSSTTGGDTIAQLQRAAIEFTRVYQDPKLAEQLPAARKEVIAKIMIAITLDALSEKRGDELLEMLAELMKVK